MEQKSLRKERNSNLELLRIAAACGVIALHYNDMSIANQTNALALSMNECLWAWSVDVFLMISGYCSSRRMEIDWKKPVRLYVQLVFFRLFAALLTAFLSGELTVGELLYSFLPINYFFCIVCVYIIL